MTEELNEQMAPVEPAAEPQQNQPAGGSDAKYTDAYVKARIDKQNVKHANEMAEKDSQIEDLRKQLETAQGEADALKHQQELETWKAQAAQAAGVPASILRGDTQDEINQHAEAIKAAIPAYPPIHDSGAPATPQKIAQKDTLSMTNEQIHEAIKKGLI